MDPKKITINGNTYTAEPLNPHEAIGWANRLIPVVGPVLTDKSLDKWNGPEASRLMQEAVARCWTPENEKLSEQAVFNRWFQKHPRDLIELGARAAFEVARDFLPEALHTALESFQMPGTAGTGGAAAG